MSLAYWCIVIAALIPYLALGLTLIPSKTVPARWGASYDNRDPRQSTDKLVGWRRRAQNAQANSYEAFPPFAAAVLMAQTLRGSSLALDAWAGAFVALRLLYCGCYVGNFATARSTIWFFATACVLALFGIAAGF